jgi:hypothetical protein
LVSTARRTSIVHCLRQLGPGRSRTGTPSAFRSFKVTAVEAGLGNSHQASVLPLLPGSPCLTHRCSSCVPSLHQSPCPLPVHACVRTYLYERAARALLQLSDTPSLLPVPGYSHRSRWEDTASAFSVTGFSATECTSSSVHHGPPGQPGGGQGWGRGMNLNTWLPRRPHSSTSWSLGRSLPICLTDGEPKRAGKPLPFHACCLAHSCSTLSSHFSFLFNPDSTPSTTALPH